MDDRATDWTTDVARHEEEMAGRRARVGLAAPTMMFTARPDITVHEVEDNGSFAAGMSSPNGYLARQPAADEPRDHHITGHRFHRTWVQGPWHWDLWLFDDVKMDDAQLAAFRDPSPPPTSAEKNNARTPGLRGAGRGFALFKADDGQRRQ